MRFGSLDGVMRGVMMVAVGHLRVMSGQLMIAGFVMTRRFPVMPRCVFVVFRCLVMMLDCFSGHLLFLRVG